jgi:hypothetical protein
MAQETIRTELRLPVAMMAKVDHLAASSGINRSATIKTLLAAALSSVQAPQAGETND